jgi:proteasome assembly chaperone (PAC2) family protein
MDMEEIIYHEKPLLHKPCLIIGFEGWPNAAEVSSTALQHLIKTTEAKKFATLRSEHFYQTSLARPVGIIKEGRLVELRFGENHFYYSKELSPVDLIFFQGIEPHLRWDVFAEVLLSVADKYEVSRLFTIGGTYDYIPHSYPPRVSALFNHESLKEDIVERGISLTEYTGPISIHTFILEAARKRGLKGVSLWGHAPQYLQARNVKVVHAVLKKLNDLLEMDIDLSDLRQAGEYFDQQINQLMEQDPKLQEVIGKLEDVYKESEKLPLSSGEERAKEEKVVYLQAFFKKPGDEEKKGG